MSFPVKTLLLLTKVTIIQNCSLQPVFIIETPNITDIKNT